MSMSKSDGALLAGVGVWNIAIWSNFAKNLTKTARDPEQERSTWYYAAHAGLIVIDTALGGLLLAKGVKAIFGRG